MQVSGSPTICLRFELYGCDTDVRPLTSLRALTTSRGQIEVEWDPPAADTTLEFESPAGSTFRPTGYAVLHRPAESREFVSTATAERTVSLEDVRLGATYVVQLRCLVGDVSIDCGSTQIEAYPPCPETWSSGNEYHCFLHLAHVTSFAEARVACLEGGDAGEKLGELGRLVDDDERAFLAARILPQDEEELWLVGNATCRGDGDCCSILRKDADGVLRESECGTEELKSAVCLRDHKGEGSKIRVSTIKASADGASARIFWRYEGKGWKTDKLQAKMWTESGDVANTFTFSTLEDSFALDGLRPGTMYSLVLKPAPNIRTEEIDYKFIIVDFGENSYGALLTPAPMAGYVLWSGTLRVKWSAAEAHSVSGNVKEAAQYTISHQVALPDVSPTEIIVESGYEFRLTPLLMGTEYVFRLTCQFAGVHHPCGVATVRTDPPDHIRREAGGLHTLYEVVDDARRRTWFEAEEDCRQRSGHLASLLDEAEGRTLLRILPTGDAKVWTGAKLKRNGTSYWTDGNKITYLPMARNSGVLPDRDSCCRALGEAGRLRVAGGPCGDALPHVCKYAVRDILPPPAQLLAASQSSNSVEFKWQRPSEGWLPTFYSVRMCRMENPAECPVEKELREMWNFNAENLSEFTAYDVTVKAVLQALNVTANASKTMYTYPKKPVRFRISSSGEMSLETPILVAMEMLPDARVTVSLYRGVREEGPVWEGDTRLVSISGLVPEERYRLVVAQKTDEQKKWTYETSFDAVPTCLGTSDATLGSLCCRLVDSQLDFEGSVSRCGSMVQAAEASSASPSALYAADSSTDVEALTNLTKDLELEGNFWVGLPTTDGAAESADAEECSVRSGNRECCSYVIARKRIVCSFCCDVKQAFLCAYTVPVDLGRVSDLLPSSVGNDFVGVRWSDVGGDVAWDIPRHEVRWAATEEDAATQTRVVEAAAALLEGLEYGTEYEIVVTPLGKERTRGRGSKLLVTTLDPRPALTVVVQADGVTRVSSPLLVEKGRGREEVDVAIAALDGKRTAGARGRAEGVEVTGLEPGAEYAVVMTPAAPGGKRPFNYSGTFKAFPNCAENQIQSGLVCVWAVGQSRSRRDAAEVCRVDAGELLDFGTQRALAPAVKARLAALVQKRFWMDLSSDAGAASAALVDAEECSGVRESEIMCCTFEATSGGELEDLKCTCCQEPRPFACKRENKINLGDIGNITVEDATQTSLRLGWTLASDCKWRKPAFLVTWDSLAANGKRKKRAASNRIVVQDAETTLGGLRPGTSYQVAVSPYTDSTRVGGAGGKEITVTTREEVIVAGYRDSRCTMTILKISCCVSVILGSSFTVFVFIATRMFYLDCVAQLLMELSLLGAYLCILVSSAQTYSMDNECGRAHPALCVAVAALIQFFFQSVFLFFLLESIIVCTALKDYLPARCTPRSPLALAALGFGVPAVLNIVIAAIERDGYTDKKENCWLYLGGPAVLPSVIPVLVSCVCTLFFLLSAFDADEPREGDAPEITADRGRIFLKTRWSCFGVFALTAVCYSTGLFGANSRDLPALNYVFVGFSMALALLLPLLRIRCDDHVRGQLRRGLFASLREDVGGIRVTPAPPNSAALLKMSQFDNPKFERQRQMLDMALRKGEPSVDPDIVRHR